MTWKQNNKHKGKTKQKNGPELIITWENKYITTRTTKVRMWMKSEKFDSKDLKRLKKNQNIEKTF